MPAAFKVGGLTMHRLSQLPVEHKRSTPKYSPLSDTALDAIRKALKNVAIVIVDEISMVSYVNFLYMHLRLVEIFDKFDNKDGWFGKMHLLVFGDLVQLPLISYGPVFVPVPTETLN